LFYLFVYHLVVNKYYQNYNYAEVLINQKLKHTYYPYLNYIAYLKAATISCCYIL